MRKLSFVRGEVNPHVHRIRSRPRPRRKDKQMYHNISDKPFEHYDRIARFERSKAFHAALSAIAALFKTRRAPKPAVGDCVA